jgi:hypothetical protein
MLRLLAYIVHTKSEQSMFIKLHGIPIFSPRSMDLAISILIYSFYETVANVSKQNVRRISEPARKAGGRRKLRRLILLTIHQMSGW